jgi:hypothetical protein
MSLNNITFVLGQGGLGRPLPGEDYISGLIFYVANGSLPSGFTTSARIRQFFSVADAGAAGIKDDYSDGTAAAGSVQITAIGTNGDTISDYVVTPTGNVDLYTYTKTAAETTATLVGAAIAALINAGTINHGFTAVNTTGTVAITAPKKYGIYLNTGTKLVTTLSSGATLAATTTQFSGGAASKQAVWHYHISEYFRIQPKGNLYVGFFAVPTTYDFADVATMQNFATGKLRQIGVYKDAAAFASADLTALHNACNAQVALHKELIGLYGADIAAVTDLTTLSDLSTLSAYLAHPRIGQDGGALGAFLYATVGKSITDLGAALGAVALAKVSEDIAWVEKFNMSNGTELDIPAIANGALVRDQTEGLLGSIQDKAYGFIRTFVGTSGSYNNESRTAIAITSDYAYIENNRTIQKATRGVYSSMLPALNSPITLNADGTLSDVSIAYFENLAEKNLFQMQRDGEISGTPEKPGFSVAINASQNVLSTGKLVVAISIIPIGVARNITVNIGFNVSIS